MQFKEEMRKLGFSISATFSCPICCHEVEDAFDLRVRVHCQEHDKQQLLYASKTLLDAWSFSIGLPTASVYGEGGFKGILAGHWQHSLVQQV
jgi:hypothetical protein